MPAPGSFDPPTGTAVPLPIGVVSDVRLYRDGLAEGLARRAGLAVVWTAGDARSAVAHAADGSATAVVLDLSTHESLGLARAMRQVAPALAIVAFASHDLDREIIECAEAGIGGLVSCDGSLDDLAVALTRAAHGEMSCSPRAAAVLMRRVAAVAASVAVAPAPSGVDDTLTLRERSILELLDAGLSNKEIAARLHIQVATVKNHVHNVLEKLRVASRSEAAAKHRAAAGPPSLRSLLPQDSRTKAAKI